MHKNMKKKLKDSRGETLVEMLASILIGTLAVSMLVSAIMVSVRINKQAQASDASFYEGLTAAELQETPIGEDATLKKYNIEITSDEQNAENIKISVNLYGSNGIYSYKIAE
jgi:competence protein ComGC